MASLRRLALLPLLATLLLPAACDDSEGAEATTTSTGYEARQPPGPPAATVRAAPAAAAGVPTASFRHTVRGVDSEIVLDGAYDTASGLLDGQITTTLPGSAGSRPIRFDGSALYLQIPPENPQRLPGKHWIRVALGEAGQPWTELIERMLTLDPRGFLALPGGMVGDDVTISGEPSSTPGGLVTRGHLFRAEVAVARDRSPAPFRQSAERLAGQLGPGPVEVSFFFDAAGRPSLVRWSGITRRPAPTGHQQAVLEIFDYGKPFTASAPAGDAVDLSVVADPLKLLS